MSKVTTVLVLSAIVMFVAGTVQAEPIVDNFWADADRYGAFYGGGSGEGWIEQNGWHTQWFYDHPLDLTRWKEIEVYGDVEAFEPGMPPDFPGLFPGDVGIAEAGYIDIAVNWSNDQWSTGLPGEAYPPTDPGYIVYESIWQGTLYFEWEWIEIDLGVYEWEPLMPIMEGFWGFVVIPDYNPEWVSIDVRGENFYIDGIIQHECIPEPATMSLLVLGGIGALLRRRRK